MPDRRKQKRLKIGNVVYIYSSSISEAFVGKIIDISRTGISFSYIMEFPAPDNMNEVGILVPNVGPVLRKLSFKTISDEIFQDYPRGAIITRRRSGIFQNLSPEQERELEEFIEYYDDCII